MRDAMRSRAASRTRALALTLVAALPALLPLWPRDSPALLVAHAANVPILTSTGSGFVYNDFEDDPSVAAVGLGLVFAGDAAYYSRRLDACGVCSGDNSTCEGCDGVPLSGAVYDACGDCLLPRDKAFNTSCADCAGEPNGPLRIDLCGECHEPADATVFSMSCAGCDGVANSGKTNDDCGVCDGDAFAGTRRSYRGHPDDELPYECLDCADVPHGQNYVDLCCGCVSETQAGDRPMGDIAPEPPPAHAHALALFRHAAELLANATALESTWRAHHDATLGYDGEEPNSYATLPLVEAYTAAREAFESAWGVVHSDEADDNSTCYAEAFVLLNSTEPPRDICGVCGGDNATCLGCDGLPLPYGEGLMVDDCGVCGGENGALDDCGVCFGGNNTCRGCDGMPNSGMLMDACGQCLDPRDPTFDSTCAGCDGVPNSGAVIDDCGVCAVPGTDAFNAGCTGCDGVAHSGLVYDACCECGGNATVDSECYTLILEEQERQLNSVIPWTDALNITRDLPLLHVTMGDQSEPSSIQGQPYDACGVCFGDSRSCLGCDGVPASSALVDACGVCAGNCSACVPRCAEQECVFVGPDGAGEAACEIYAPPVPELAERERKDWVVVLYNREFGPFSIEELEIGAIMAVNPVNKEPVMHSLTPETMVGHLYREERTTQVTYGNASQQASQPQAWSKFYDLDANPVAEDGTRIGGRQTDPSTCTLQCLEYACKVPESEWSGSTCPELDFSISRCVTSGAECIIGNGLRCDEVKYSWLTAAQQAAVWARPEMNQNPVEWFDGERCGHLSALGGVGAAELGCDGTLTSPCSDRWLEDLVENVVTITQIETHLYHGGYLPMSVMPGLERVVYDACTGASSRAGVHELHGKRTGINDLGLLTLAPNLTAFGGALAMGAHDMDWNPDERYIYDVVETWHDLSCTCSATWVFKDSEPIPPTCPRAWRSWEEWEDYDNVFVADNRRYEYSAVRSLSRGSWKVSGGWWAKDVGGGAVSKRGAFRIGSHGSLAVHTVDTLPTHSWPAEGTYTSLAHEHVASPPRGPVNPYDLDEYGDESDAGGFGKDGHSGTGVATVGRSYTTLRPFTEVGLPPGACYRAARVVPAAAHASGALWYPQQQSVAQGFEFVVRFQAVDRARACRDVSTLSRSMSLEIRTGLHRTCEHAGADGLALVISGDDSGFKNNAPGALGEGGPGLGYAGLISTLAVELDSWANAELGEPPGEHIAVHASNAGEAVSARHAHRLGAAVLGSGVHARAGSSRTSISADGHVHTVRVVYRPAGRNGFGSSGPDLVAALESGAYDARELSEHFVAGGEAGSLEVFLDDAPGPQLRVPLSLAAVLGADRSRAWVGVTAATGERWQAIDVFSMQFDSF